MGAAELRKASDGDLSATVRRLARENEALRKELTDLRGRLGKTLADADGAYGAGPHASEAGPDAPPAVAGVPCSVPCPWTSSGHGLSQAELHRYSRQIILDAFGPDRQAQLLRSSALVRDPRACLGTCLVVPRNTPTQYDPYLSPLLLRSSVRVASGARLPSTWRRWAWAGWA